MADQELTTTQVAERLKAADVTVRLWCRQGRFPNARLVEHPRGDYWVIPESEVKKFEPPQMGRPSKQSTANKAATAPAHGANAALTAAGRAKKKSKNNGKK
jgi:hypothetical protein